MLVGPAVVPDGVTKLTVGERVDGDDRALIPLVELRLALDALPEHLDAGADGGIRRDHRLLGRLHSRRRVLGREEHERLGGGELDLARHVVLRSAGRHARAREFELV